MSVRRLESTLGETAEAVLKSLVDPRDEVSYAVWMSSLPAEVEHEGETYSTETPGVGLFVSVRPRGLHASVMVQGIVPLALAASSDAFAQSVEMMWSQLEFRRIALTLPDLEMRGDRLIEEDLT